LFVALIRKSKPIDCLVQVRRRKCAANKGDTARPTANLADDVVAVLGLLNTHPFVQKVFLSKGKSPTVVLYT